MRDAPKSADQCGLDGHGWAGSLAGPRAAEGLQEPMCSSAPRLKGCRVKLLLFLGAGVSKSSSLPTAIELTDELFVPRAVEDDDTTRVRALLTVIKEHDTADIGRVGLSPRFGGFQSSGAIYRGSKSTYEDLYFLCQQISLWNIGLSDNSLVTPFIERIEEKARGLLFGSSIEARMCDLAKLGRRMCTYIEAFVAKTLQRKYVAGLDLIGELANAIDVEQLNIVTLNHDTLVEQFLSAKGMELVDGFGEHDGDVRWSDERVYEDERARTRLFKLHGSVNWYLFQYEGRLRPAIFLGTDLTSARDGTGKPLRPEYLTPSFLTGINKADAYQRGIYTDIHFHFAKLLRQCDRILMSGYGWGDTAINFRLDAWLERSRDNKIVLLHKRSEELMSRSLVFASGYNGWINSGQLACVDRWLSDVSLTDLSGPLV
jgi:hypothetical protein